MSSGERYKKEAEDLLSDAPGRRLADITNKFQLAASEFAKEGKTEEASECEALYRFYSGFLYLVSAYTLDDVKQAIKHFRRAGRLLKAFDDPEPQALSELSEAYLLLSKGMLGLWKRDIDGATKLFEKANKQLSRIKDAVPEFSELAETPQLEALGEYHSAKAFEAFFKDDLTSYTSHIGESIRLIKRLVSISREELKRFYTALLYSRQASNKLISTASTTISKDKAIVQTTLKEADDLLSQSIKEFSAVIALNPKVKTLKMQAVGTQNLIKAFSQEGEALVELFSGRPQSAREKFENAFERANEAIKISSEIGVWGSQILPVAIQVRDRSRNYATSIAMTAKRRKRRIAIDASKQFFLVFFISLATFIVLNYTKLLQTAALHQLYFSLIVAAVTAFGLNAVKLKELVFPSHRSRATEQADSP